MFLIDDDSLPESETLFHFFCNTERFWKSKKNLKKEENMKKEKKKPKTKQFHLTASDTHSTFRGFFFFGSSSSVDSAECGRFLDSLSGSPFLNSSYVMIL